MVSMHLRPFSKSRFSAETNIILHIFFSVFHMNVSAFALMVFADCEADGTLSLANLLALFSSSKNSAKLSQSKSNVECRYAQVVSL